jgi:hypothetical protein
MQIKSVLSTWGLCLLPISALALNQSNFSDNTFNPADWQLTIAWEFNPGTTTASFQQMASGGNAGSFGRVNMTSRAPNAVALMHQGSVYDPSVQGPIASIMAGADLRTPGSTTYRPLIFQGGNYFYGIWAMGVSSSTWTPFAFGNNVLTEDRFIGVGAANSLSPDFSATGEPIQFGFMVDHGTTFSTRTTDLGVDNWQVTITTVPEPSAWALLAVAVAVFQMPKPRS